MSANESRDNPGSSHGDGGGAASAVVVARPLAQSRRPHPFSGATRSAVITSRHVTAGPDKAVGSGSGTVGRTSPRRQHTRTPTKLQTPEGRLSMLLTLVQTDESVVTARCQTGPLTDRITRPAYRGGDGARTGLAPARPHGEARALSLWLRFNQVCVSSASRQTRRSACTWLSFPGFALCSVLAPEGDLQTEPPSAVRAGNTLGVYPQSDVKTATPRGPCLCGECPSDTRWEPFTLFPARVCTAGGTPGRQTAQVPLSQPDSLHFSATCSVGKL